MAMNQAFLMEPSSPDEDLNIGELLYEYRTDHTGASAVYTKTDLAPVCYKPTLRLPHRRCAAHRPTAGSAQLSAGVRLQILISFLSL